MTDTFRPATTSHGLRCPKCDGEMTTYERSGIVVDRCRECRGVFLDRGELERIVDAEGLGSLAAPRHRAELDAAAGASAQDRARLVGADRRYGDREESRRGRDDDWDDDRGDRRRGGRRSFLTELIEGFGE